jgi:hypothetical protein
LADRVKLVAGGKPKTDTDLRRVLDDKNIDCVAITMPNYWHALATVWACQAGKNVYVGKPATCCIVEGRRMAPYRFVKSCEMPTAPKNQQKKPCPNCLPDKAL